MERRRAERLKKRMPCAMTIDRKHHSGVVLDLSANGFFVLTSAAPPAGTAVRLDLHAPGVEQTIVVQTSVARRRAVPANLKSVAQGGLGLRIESAPEEYYTYFAGLLPDPRPGARPPARRKKQKEADDQAEAPSQPRRSRTRLERRARQLALRRALGPRAPRAGEKRFHVRVARGARCRSLEILASDEDEACLEASEQVGRGWKVLGCRRAGEA